MNLLLVVVSFLALIFTPAIVFAQDAGHSPSPSPQVSSQHQGVTKQHQQEVEKKHQQFQEHLKQVQNKHHAQVAERIHQNLNHVNDTTTSSWLKNINHMNEILAKLEEHLNKAASEGKDISQAQTSVNNAKTQVTAAESALSTQAGKVYTITITDPGHIGPDVKTSRDTLHTDLQNVHQTLKTAKAAVVEATKAVNQALGDQNGT